MVGIIGFFCSVHIFSSSNDQLLGDGKVNSLSSLKKTTDYDQCFMRAAELLKKVWRDGI